MGAFVPSTPATSSVVAAANSPPELPAPVTVPSYILSTTDAASKRFTVGPYALGATPADDYMASMWARPLTGVLKFSIFILDQSLAFLEDHNFELNPANPRWQEFKFPFLRGAATSIYYAIALRQFVGSSGGSVEILAPCITANIASERRQKGYLGSGARRNIEGSVLAVPTLVQFGLEKRVFATAIVSTALPINASPFVVINSAAGGTTVNQFTQVDTGQEFEVLNLSGGVITIANASLAGGAGGFALADKASRRFISYSGAIYALA